MLSRTFTIFLLNSLVYAKIHVNIVVSSEETERKIETSGSVEEIIKDNERTAFNLVDVSLKNAVKEYFGETPDDVYVRSPTPWGDLYTSYNWPQVSRILTSESVTILSYKFEPVVILTQYFNNNSSKTAEFITNIAQKVENTVASSWIKDKDMDINEETEYSVELKVAAVSGRSHYSYTSKWGVDVSKSDWVTVGAESSEITLSLEPNKTLIAELYAMKGFMEVQVDYVASLAGTVAVNYGNTYKGHHFWSLDVNSILRTAGLNTTVMSSEVIGLGFYYDSRVVIRDAESNVTVYEFSMP